MGSEASARVRPGGVNANARGRAAVGAKIMDLLGWMMHSGQDMIPPMMDGSDPIECFLDLLARKNRGLLLLDYDGTIAPFVPHRHAAQPADGLGELIERLLAQKGTRIVFVTGRPCRELVLVSGLRTPVEIWGCHGREHLDLAGRLAIVGVSPAASAALGHAAAVASRILPVEALETKTGCVTFHCRALASPSVAAIEEQVRRAWAPLAIDGELLLKDFDGGIELCAPGRTKGDAVEDLLACYGREYDAVAFLGDDLTDEDGFRALKGRGLCLLVRNEPRETLADARISMPEGIAQFLGGWHAALQGAAS